MSPSALITLATLALAATAASADTYPTIEFLPPGYLLSDLSQDGSVGCGNVQGDGSFETFRWTSAGGPVRLGRATVPAIGVGGGSPDISYDGTRISASILSSDNRQTQGIWDQSTGWFEVFPPMPPDGVLSDQSYASAWGLSGDGTTITGFYYSNWSGQTRARPSKWSTINGLTALPSNPGFSSRVNAANFDGTIVGGWEDHGGPWWPTVWRNGVKINVNDGNGGGGGQVFDVSHDGTFLVGMEYSEILTTRVATIWTWNGATYVMNNIGNLPGTVSNGQCYISAVTSDGSMAVGSNIYTISPGADRDGIVWTPAGGLVNATDYIASLGLSAHFTPNMDIRELSAVSPDGSVITGALLDTVGAFFQSFVIRLAPPPGCLGDADGNGSVNFADITAVLANFGSTGAPFSVGDADGNTTVNFADITAVLANFGTACP